MKIAIVGSRRGIPESFVREQLDQLIMNGFIPAKGSEVISGGAVGTDTFAELWAMDRKMPITIIRPLKKTREAFLKRNLEIARTCDKIIAFKYKNSNTHGTEHAYYATLEKGKTGVLIHYPVIQTETNNTFTTKS